ncbi:hypothetical protein ACWCQS_09165 [Streptomyces sp. NPDC002076]
MPESPGRLPRAFPSRVGVLVAVDVAEAELVGDAFVRLQAAGDTPGASGTVPVAEPGPRAVPWVIHAWPASGEPEIGVPSLVLGSPAALPWHAPS